MAMRRTTTGSRWCSSQLSVPPVFSWPTRGWGASSLVLGPAWPRQSSPLAAPGWTASGGTQTAPFRTSSGTLQRDEDDEDEDADDDEDDEDDEDEDEEEDVGGVQRRAGAGAGGKYAAEDAEMEFLERAFVWEYRSMHAPRPMLAEATKREMHRLHRQDPARWNLDALSLHFGLQKARVQAILILMGMRDEALRHGEVLHGRAIELLEQEFGVVQRMADKRLLNTERSGGRPGSGLPLEEDALDHDHRLLDHHKALRLARKPRGLGGPAMLPAHPPKSADGSPVPEAQSRILRRPTPTQPRDHKGMIFVEKDSRRPRWGRRHRINDAKRIIYITEPDGTLRTPTWDERRRLTQRQLPYPKPFDPAEKRFFKDDY